MAKLFSLPDCKLLYQVKGKERILHPIFSNPPHFPSYNLTFLPCSYESGENLWSSTFSSYSGPELGCLFISPNEPQEMDLTPTIVDCWGHNEFRVLGFITLPEPFRQEDPPRHHAYVIMGNYELIQIRDCYTGRQRVMFRGDGHECLVGATPDRIAFHSGKSGLVTILSLPEFEKISELKTTKNGVSALSPDGKIIAQYSKSNTLYAWDINSGKQVKVGAWQAEYPHLLTFASNTHITLRKDSETELYFINVATGQLRSHDFNHRINNLSVSGDGQWLAVGYSDRLSDPEEESHPITLISLQSFLP